MPPNPTDFYLNLDRWETLSAVERERGAWRARFEGPTSRIDPIRQEAAFQAAWSFHLPDRTPDARSREKVVGPIPPPEGKLPGLLRAWHYCRAVRFVEGWYPAFSWTTAGVEQIARLLLDPTERLEEGISSRLVTSYHESGRLSEEIGRIPIFQCAAFYGTIERLNGDKDIYWQLQVLALRLLLLQKGYFQVLAAPIEPHLCGRFEGSQPGVPGAGRAAAPSPEGLLGAWLDGVTDLLLDVGKRAEESWARSKSLEPRTSLQETILTLALQHGRVTAGDILRATGANRNTVKDNLARLVQEGSLQKHGEKRGTIYVPA